MSNFTSFQLEGFSFTEDTYLVWRVDAEFSFNAKKLKDTIKKEEEIKL